MNSIFTRTSVRKFTDQKIEKEKIDLILKAGFAAPSASNRQPWEFIVVDDTEKITKMSTFTQYSKPMEKAAFGMVVCANLERNDKVDFCEQDCAAATQNMLVEAHELGIGSVWIGVYPNDDRVQVLRDYFSLPDNIVPLWMIAFGYPDETPAVKDKYKPEYIHYNKW